MNRSGTGKYWDHRCVCVTLILTNMTDMKMGRTSQVHIVRSTQGRSWVSSEVIQIGVENGTGFLN